MAFTKITAAGIGSTETVTLDGLSVINDGSFGGNVSVAGTLTYEDVTNIDSVGLITARAGIVVGSGITLSKDGDGFYTGVVTATSYAGDGSALTGVAATDNVRTGILDVAGVSTFRSNIFQTGGRIVRGSTSTIQDGDAIAGGVNITGTDMDASVIMSVFGNDNDFNRISGAKSRNATIGSHTVVNDGDTLLSLKGFGSDGTNFEEAAQLEFQVDGSPGDNDMPGRMVFKTTADGASSPTERMRITSAGYVTKPNLPYFYATADPSITSNYVHSFGNVLGNNGSHYNNTNGRFTAPVAGFYWFAVGIWCSNSNGASAFIQLTRNINSSGSEVSFAGCNHTIQYDNLNASGGTYMAKDDFVFIKQSSVTIQPSTPRNFFSGYLVG